MVLVIMVIILISKPASQIMILVKNGRNSMIRVKQGPIPMKFFGEKSLQVVNQAVSLIRETISQIMIKLIILTAQVII